MAGLSKAQLLELADAKIASAKVLLAAGVPSDAYYLAGYAAELTIKALIAKRFEAETMPDPVLVRRLYTHDLTSLLQQADIAQALKERASRESAFDSAVKIVLEWDETTRYAAISPGKADAFISALADEATGLIAWIRSFI